MVEVKAIGVLVLLLYTRRKPTILNLATRVGLLLGLLWVPPLKSVHSFIFLIRFKTGLKLNNVLPNLCIVMWAEEGHGCISSFRICHIAEVLLR